MLLETLKRHWWVPVLRGVCAIIFGIMAFKYPGLTVVVLVMLFGAWVLVDGIFRIIGAIGHRSSDTDWGWQLVIGILGIIIGFLTFHKPGITALALVIYIGAWALMIGATEIALAIKVRREIKGEWFLIPYGPDFNRVCDHAPVEPASWCSRSGVADRVLRNRVRSFGYYFWLSPA